MHRLARDQRIADHLNAGLRGSRRAPAARSSLADDDDDVGGDLFGLARHDVAQSAPPSPIAARAVNGRTVSGAPRRRASSWARPSGGSVAPNAAPGVATVMLAHPAAIPSSTALAHGHRRSHRRGPESRTRAQGIGAARDRIGRGQRTLDAGQLRQRLVTADRDDDLVEAVQVGGAGMVPSSSATWSARSTAAE